jgi:hypothetical protein
MTRQHPASLGGTPGSIVAAVVLLVVVAVALIADPGRASQPPLRSPGASHRTDATSSTATELLPPGEGPEGQALSVWSPSASWDGEEQADARLDRPVRFWRVGVTLAEVFSEVQQQTGVRLGFWPLDDTNRRVRVTLLLNPGQPPSLRELMVQLSWVTDCCFAFHMEAKTGARVYDLLSTSLGEAVEREAQEGPQRQLDYWRERRRRDQEESLARIKVYAAALKLPRDELAQQYRGKDDYLLYNLLDQHRRAALEYFTNLPEETVRALTCEELRILRPLSEFSAEERARLERAIGYEQGWPDPDKIIVSVLSDGVMAHLGAGLGSLIAGEQEVKDWKPIGTSSSWGWPEECELRPADAMGLRRLLGERVSEEEERTFVARQEQRSQDEHAATSAQREQKAHEGYRMLSPAMLQRLALSVPSAAKTPLLWELQEVVARELGVNVVSDAFCDLRREYVRPTEALTMREYLDRACTPRMPREELLADWEDINASACSGWEWGDAGSFLRFRSVLRDLWRAALLPEDALSRLESWSAPYLTPDSIEKLRRNALRVPVDFDMTFWLATHLTTTQVRYGGYLYYGDPSDEREVWALGLRQHLLGEISWRGTYKLFATLSAKQWEQARGNGLQLGHDLTPDQRQLAKESRSRLVNGAVLSDPLERYVLRVRDGGAVMPGASDIPAPWHLEIFKDGKLVGKSQLASCLYPVLAAQVLRPRSPKAEGKGRDAVSQ